MIKDHKFEINYIFHNQPMADVLDAEHETMTQHDAAHYLLEKHRQGLGSEAPPAADAKPEDILHFARDHGITDIRVSKVHSHPKGDAPGHYQQP